MNGTRADVEVTETSGRSPRGVSEENESLKSDERNNESSNDEDEETGKKLNFASTNARSIAPKIVSMIECFRELDLTFFSVTETWLKGDPQTRKEIEDLKNAERISILTKNRQRRGGGVMLAFDQNKADFKLVKLNNNKYELICCEGNIDGISQDVIVLTAYLPPKMTTSTLEDFCTCVSENLDEILVRLPNPLVILTGDFNKKDVSSAINDFPEIKCLRTGATRNGAQLDLVYTNFDSKVRESRVLPPLESNDGESSSDHSIVYVTSNFPKVHRFKKRTITFRPYTRRGEELFGRMLASTDWSFLHDCHDRAAALGKRLDEFTSIAFPQKTRVIKSTDKPWITKEIKQLARRKRREYKRKRRSERWEILEQRLTSKLETARLEFFDRIKKKVVESNNTRAYFRAVKQLTEGDCSNDGWSIDRMFPGKSEQEIAEHVADFFNSISQEYTPLAEVEPVDSSCFCPEFYKIAERLRAIKKPNSHVPGDINKRLVSKFSDALAIPLWIVFDRAFRESTWPTPWKTETVTVIPKTSSPKSLSELRNLSCTPLFSKVMETFVRDRLKEEVSLNDSQFGGIKGSSVDHFLIETWDGILRALEDSRASATVSSIDFEKAFNRVCHHECLAAAADLGASPPTIAMIRAFLTGRVMTVKVGLARSTPRPVSGGSPQGSILGNQLFCILTDQLNKCIPRSVSNLSTVSFENNGADMSASSGSLDVSPIARPLQDITLGSESEEEEIRASNFICFNPANRMYDTELSAIAGQDTINEFMGPVEGWVDQQLEMKVYIDDVNVVEKVSKVNAVSLISQKKRILKVHAQETDRFFENVSTTADSIKMRVNQAKTNILCMSASVHDEVLAYIRPCIKGLTTESVSGPTLKIVGFNFNSSPTVKHHITIMCNKFRSKLWSLRKLKRNGMAQSDLIFIYKSVLRPILEFCCVTYGPMLTAELSSQIERLQLRVMKVIYGMRVSYRTVLEMTSLETLQQRRNTRLRNFAIKTSRNPRFAERWFPKNPPPVHHTRNPKIYLEEKATTDRLYNSPLYTMRRLLNAL